MNHYLLLLRSESMDFAGYSGDEMQRLLAEFDAWNAGMIERSRLIASASLAASKGGTLRGGPVVVDGPYAEAREAITGFIVIAAASLEEAVSEAAGCPFLPRGGSVEVRPISQLEFEDAAGPLVEDHARARRESRSAEV